jgi:hypothetical protein
MGILRECFIQDLTLSGRSERTVECYVAPYVCRMAISNNRIVKTEDRRRLPFSG